ncbi:MAG TPA: N-acetylglucosamine-6-phosphate deacetylase [Firmicutes bacterium]|nr:N-acetylglucosamine-6-phosphate deacetylase [Bacillota bacterium]
MKNLIITNGTIIADELIPQGTVVCIGDRIIYVGEEEEGEKIKKAAQSSVFEIIDAQGALIGPGLIDIHIHGSDGVDLMDGRKESLQTMARYAVKFGTVAFLPTTVTASRENTRKVSRLVADYVGGPNEAEVLGLHLEGPYINEKRKGAQYGPAIRAADLAELADLYEILGPKMRLITIAPEIEGGLAAIAWLKEKGVRTAIGHSDASYEEAVAGFAEGISQATHVFNGMRGLHHRDPGVVGAVLASPEIWAQLIADLVHVHPGAIRVLLESKGVDKIVLITDAVQAAGLPDGEYVLGDLDIVVEGGSARLPEGNLAGSTLNMMQAVKNMVESLDVSLSHAFQMASLNPARSLGLENRGWIREGNRADFVLFSPDYEVLKTIVAGRVAYAV